MSDGQRSAKRRAATLLMLLAPLALLGGCQALAITALGVGASAGVMHTAGSIHYRTFTAKVPQVRRALLAALQKMDLEVQGIDKRDGADVITARGARRDIEIVLEKMSRSTTQLRATAKHNVFVHDSATAREIVEQTEAALEALGESRGRRVGRGPADATIHATLR